MPSFAVRSWHGGFCCSFFHVAGSRGAGAPPHVQRASAAAAAAPYSWTAFVTDILASQVNHRRQELPHVPRRRRTLVWEDLKRGYSHGGVCGHGARRKKQKQRTDNQRKGDGPRFGVPWPCRLRPLFLAAFVRKVAFCTSFERAFWCLPSAATRYARM